MSEPALTRPSKRAQTKTREFIYDPSKRLEGIVNFLMTAFRKASHGRPVHVTASSVVCPGDCYHPRNVATFAYSSPIFMSKDEPDSWVCYDFINFRVIPTSYSVRSISSGPGSAHPKSWVIEVSNDRYTWTEIDRRENSQELNGKYKTRNFAISPVLSECFRFIRLRQTGPNHKGTNELTIVSLELFGTLSKAHKIEEPLVQEFVYKADKEGLFPPPLFPPKFDGIITHLTLECGGNVHEKGLVYATGNGIDPKSVADLWTDSFYYSNCQNAWICYDFNDRRVIPKGYTLRSYDTCPGGPNLKCWVIEVSNDGYSWEEIDFQFDCEDMNQNFATVYFEIDGAPTDSFRFIRLRQLDENHSGNYKVYLTGLEVFGTLLFAEKVEKPHLPMQKFVYKGEIEGEEDSPPPIFPPQLDGIIAHLTRECGGNVHDRGVVYVSASSIRRDDEHPKNVLDLMTNSAYVSCREKFAWVCFDFMKRRVIPTSYTLRSHGGAKDEWHLRYWVIEVANQSKGKLSWVEIDGRSNDALNDKYATCNFKISKVPSEGFQFLRLRQTGLNHHGYNSCGCLDLKFVALEVFGTLIET